MLSQKPEEPEMALAPVADVEEGVSEESIQAMMELIQASPEFQMAQDFGQYLTSPFDDESPLIADDDMLATPALMSDAGFSPDVFTSPMMDFEGGDLYSGMTLFPTGPLLEEPKATVSEPVASTVPELDGLYTLPSPNTPPLDPSSLNTSPAIHDADSFPVTPAHRAFAALPKTSAAARKAAPTGTRKNITPSSLIPIDAPIQPRNYLAPSATSRKSVPAVFAKKRARSQAFGEEDEELPLDDNEEQAILAKRRQNTIAARRSRARKLEMQRMLESTVEHWKARALYLESVCAEHGITVPPASPPPL